MKFADNTRVKVKYTVSVNKETGEITINVKEGLCQYSVGGRTLTEVLNELTLRRLGVERGISQIANGETAGGFSGGFFFPTGQKETEDDFAEKQKQKYGSF